ncbi:L-lactate utilization/bacilysin biosynthesis transcriptional regulator LutR [Virgibacillus siamensis]|uniref:L-lactate utilization/bacilysin biosynthesis transcriptional regulator LutR n=1 Tax=Virgibacillus siamensis TaxID=480071 RepID=A0ABN1G5Z9_9BACI
MDIKPIKTRKIYEEVSDSFIEMLKSGELQPGDKLDSVEQLAKSFDVSRSAIREALSGLRAMGIVEMRQGEGTYIKEFDASKFSLPVATALIMKRDDIKELSEVRKILEVGAVELAAQNHLPHELEPIEKALMDMKGAKGRGDVGEKADLDFHLAIAKASHNDMLINLMSSVSDIMVESMRETRRLVLYSEEKSQQLYKEHEQIVAGIKSRNPDGAKDAMLNHLVGVERVIAEYID